MYSHCLVSFNVGTLLRAQLVLGWVTIGMWVSHPDM